MNHFLTIIALIIMLASGFWMSSNKSLLLANLSISSDWGTVGLALGACLMIISVKKLKRKDSN